MSDYDRGAYTPPTDEPLSFDARSPQRRRPMPVTLIASVVIMLVLAGAVFAFYRSGVRGANEPPRAVGKTMAAIKTPASPEDAKPVDEQALDVYVADRNAPAKAAPTFAPDPEQPQARPAGKVEVAAAPPVQAPPIQAAPIHAVPQQASAAPVIAPKPAKLAPVRTAAADVALRPVKAATPPLAKPPAKVADGPANSAGSAAVQIGAFSSAVIADQEFSKVRAGFARFASGHAKHVEPVERDGHTLYRTAFTGFSKAQADAFCSALKAAGRSCIVK